MNDNAHRAFHWIGLPIVLAVFLLRVGLHFDYTPDDTFIYLQYARNVVQHHEVSFNLGEPTYGVTSPLWLGMISVGGWSGVDFHAAAKLLDVLVALLALVALYRTQLGLTGDHIIALVTTAAFSSHIWFLRWAGSGMETSLATLLSILTVRSLLTRRYHLFAVFAALLTLTRPEAAGLFATCLILALYIDTDRTARLKIWVMVVAEFLVILLPWIVYALMEFGTFVPNTALAKSSIGFSLDDAIATAVDFGRTLGVSDGLEILVLLVVPAMYVVWHRRRKTVSEAREIESSTLWKLIRPYVLPLVWVVSLGIIYVATSANVVSRYLMLISPMIVLLAFAIPFKLLKIRFSGRSPLLLTVCLGLVLLAYNVIVFETRVRVPLAVFSKGMNECFIYIGRWLHQNTPQDASVLVGDVGAIGYYSGRRICDASGLVTPELLPLSRLGYSLQGIMHEGRYLTYCRASYVVDRSNVRHAAHDPLLFPLVTRPIYSLALSSSDTVFYTVYKVGAR